MKNPAIKKIRLQLLKIHLKALANPVFKRLNINVHSEYALQPLTRTVEECKRIIEVLTLKNKIR